MPRIEHVVGEGPEMAQSQNLVLELLEKHPTHIFRMHGDDLHEILRWLSEPDAVEPPELWADTSGYSTGTIRWVLSTLHARGKIGSVKINRRTYYGSHAAISKAEKISPSPRNGRKKAR